MSEIILADHIIKKIKRKNVIDDVSLVVNSGEILAIMGFSGAGKSTLLNLLSGLDAVSEGKIEINKTSLEGMKEPKLTSFRSKNISYIFQDYKLVDYLSVLENITITQQINHCRVDKKRLFEIVDSLQLGQVAGQKISQLSGGQKQRVAIARSLIGDNPLVFADEPTGALDVFTRNSIMKIMIENMKKYCKTLIIVTHDPYVASVAQKIAFMKSGKIIMIENRMNESEIMSKWKGVLHDD